MKKYLLVFLCFCSIDQAFSDDDTLLKGLIVTQDLSRVPAKKKPGITLKLENLPTKSKKLEEKLTPFINEPITENLLKDIQSTIGLYYEENGQLFVIVDIPRQEVEDGIVIITANLPKVGAVDYTGNNYFTPEQMQKYFLLQSGDDLAQNNLLNEVAFSNKNPFRYTEIVLRPTEKPDVIDVDFRSLNRRPIRVYAGFDNTGNDTTGNNRLYAGANWGNAFWIGDLLTYQYTCNPTLDKFQSHFGQYISYLPWKDIFMLWGGYASTKPDSNGDFSNEGQSGNASARYQIPFRPFYANFKQEIAFGFDWKYTNSNVFFGDLNLPVVQKAVNILEAIFNYGFSWSKGDHELEFGIDLHVQPWTPLPNMTQASYDQLRPGAKSYYGFFIASLADDYTFSNRSSMTWMLRLQATTAALLPMQQFSLGGYNTVRGYDEQAYLADDALCFNFEYRFPSFSIYKKIQDDLMFLVFLDAGLGHTIKKEGGLDTNEYLIGVGPGLRYRIKNNLSIRLDYGFRLHKIPYDTNSIGKVHFGGQLSF
jgi:hemolysin activation/secretion protein